MIEVHGTKQLQARLHAVQKVAGLPLMRTLGLRAVREQKLLVARKTGNTARTIRLERVTNTSATTVVQGAGPFLEGGTRAHEIRPKKGKALRFAGRGVPTTLAGRVRTGSARKLGNGAYVFAKGVHHPGTKAQPFMLPGAQKAIEETAGADAIVQAWNRAA